MDVMNRKLFASREARDRLRNMGGIMASYPELMQEAQQYQAGGPVAPVRPPYDAPPQLPLSTPQRRFIPNTVPVPSVTKSFREQLLEAARRGVSPQVTQEEMDRGRLDPESEFFDPAALAEELLRMREEGPMTYGSGSMMGGLPEDMPGPGALPGMAARDLPMSEAAAGIPADEPGRTISMGEPEGGPEQQLPVYNPAARAAAATRADQETIRDRVAEAIGRDLPDLPASTSAPDRPAMVGRPRDAEAPAAPEAAPADEAPAAAPMPEQDPMAERQARLTPDPDEDEKTLRERFDERLSLFKDVLGTESDQKAQDKAMQLAMIGLAIASGQSPDALTNIAQGALAGLESMSAQEAERRQQQRELRSSALESVMEEDAAKQEFLREAALESIKGTGGTKYSPTEAFPDAVRDLATRLMSNDGTLTLAEAMKTAEDELRRFPEYRDVPLSGTATTGDQFQIGQRAVQNGVTYEYRGNGNWVTVE